MTNKRAAPPLLSECIGEFLADAKVYRAETTFKFYDYTLEKFLADIGDQPIAEVTRAKLKAHFRELAQSGLARTSQESYGKVVRTMLKFAKREGFVESLPDFDRLFPRAKPPEKVVPQTADIEAVLRSCNGNYRDRAIILTLADTGLRRRELVDLRREHVDLANLKAYVVGKTSDGETDLQTVYLSQRCADAIRLYWKRSRWANEEYAFASLKSRPGTNGSTKLQPTAVNQLLKRLCAIASKNEGRIIKVSPHDHRRFGATKLAKAKTPLPHLMEIFRWETPAIAMRYVKLAAADVAEVHAANLPELNLN